MSASPVSAPVRVRVLEGFDDPACPPNVWNSLVRQGGTDVVYLTWEYQRAWWESLGSGELLLVAAERDGELVSIAPFYAEAGMIWFVGSGAGDYLDFVGGSVDAGVLESLLRAARERVSDFVGVRLYAVPEESPTVHAIQTAARQLGWDCYEEKRWPAPLVDLAAKPERVRLAAGSGRRERFFRHHGRLELRQFEDADTILPQLGDLFAQHIARFEMAGKESFFTDPARCAFFERVTRAAASKGWVRLNRLDWDGRAIAYEYGFRYGGVYFGGPICFAVDLARRSPGKVLFNLLVTGAIDKGLRTYDLGHGDDAYKFRFATEVRHTCTLGLYPREVLEAQWAAERPTS